MQAAPAAMERAVRRAHRDAQRHGTGVLVVVNGEMVEVEPDPALYEDDPAAKPRKRRCATELRHNRVEARFNGVDGSRASLAFYGRSKLTVRAGPS